MSTPLHAVCISLVIFIKAYCSELEILIVVGRHANLKKIIINDLITALKSTVENGKLIFNSIWQLSIT